MTWQEKMLRDAANRAKQTRTLNRKLCRELDIQEQQQQFSQANKIQKNFYYYQNCYYIFSKIFEYFQILQLSSCLLVKDAEN